jgi:hypothetical protein
MSAARSRYWDRTPPEKRAYDEDAICEIVGCSVEWLHAWVLREFNYRKPITHSWGEVERIRRIYDAEVRDAGAR